MRCNLSCAFCFNRGLKPEEDTLIKNFEKMTSVISNIGIKEIDILGGEPTLHPEFFQIMDIIYNNKLKTTISSNGCNISLLTRLSQKYNNSHIKVGISINSNVISRELHEYIIKYKPLLKSICSKEQTMPEVAKNYMEQSDMKYYLLFMDILHRDDLKKCFSFYEFFKKIEDLKDIHKNVDGVFCSGFMPDIENYPFLQYVRCPAGTTKLSVMPDGSVYPCYLFFRDNRFRLGNIFVDDFEKIWKNPILDFFRRFEKNSCINEDCELFSACHGGCPAVSLLIYGSINAPEPRCVSIPSSRK